MTSGQRCGEPLLPLRISFLRSAVTGAGGGAGAGKGSSPMRGLCRSWASPKNSLRQEGQGCKGWDREEAR